MADPTITIKMQHLDQKLLQEFKRSEELVMMEPGFAILNLANNCRLKSFPERTNQIFTVHHFPILMGNTSIRTVGIIEVFGYLEMIFQSFKETKQTFFFKYIKKPRIRTWILRTFSG